MNQDLLDRISALTAKDPERYQRHSGDDAALAKFHELFPLETLPELTLDQYCLGYGCQPENFSWWLERGLQKALGRYSPGTSRGHIIYRKRDGYYLHRSLKDLGPEGAMDVVRKTVYAIASCKSLEEAKVFRDSAELARRAGIPKEQLVGGRARKLRILTMYHPDWMLPINSIDHLKHFLIQLSEEDEPELPKGAPHLVIELSKKLDEIRNETGLEITPWGFSKILYDEELGIVPPKRSGISSGDTSDDKVGDDETAAPPPRNLILYGPPGTGKTYSTIERALEIIDPVFRQSASSEKDSRAKLKARFDELTQAKRIGFVTFHQSFSYEDFVEGLKATTDDEGQVCYEVEDGIFKQMCSSAAAVRTAGGKPASSKKIDIKGRQIWKMSLGNTSGPDTVVYDECIENGYVLLGYGWDVDFGGITNRQGIIQRLKEKYPEINSSDYAVTACNAFVNTMKPGDLVIVSDGNHKFRAIGEVTGEYRFLPLEEDREVLYQQCRDIDWFRIFSPSLPYDQLMTKAFSQATIYRPSQKAIDYDLLGALLNEEESSGDDGPRPFVLIIDEINRGNISRVFGELITLIEDSKRAGQPEALAVKLPYSKEPFTVPSNLYLVGTMNTADRSLAQVDIALRRRFVFEELMPNPSVLSKVPTVDGINVTELLKAMNRRIEVLYDREHTIGHTFFLSLRDDPSLAEMERIFSGSILPLLEEYFFEDWEKIRLVLDDHQKPPANAIIRPKYSASEIEAMFGPDHEHAIRPAYERNDDALSIPESYIGIYNSSIFNSNSSNGPTS
jgi:5-methylcytosine-specific restriction protein B